jgi:uncharacterized coiled-coil DUF342 family protein
MRIFGCHVPGTRDKAREIELLKEKRRELQEKLRDAKEAIRKGQEESITLEAEVRKLQRELAALRTRQMDLAILISKEHRN